MHKLWRGRGIRLKNNNLFIKNKMDKVTREFTFGAIKGYIINFV